MTVKTTARRISGFYTTSDRLRDIYKKAARGNKTLRNFTEFRDWSQLAAESSAAGKADASHERYVISHIEDDVEAVGPDVGRRLAEIPRLLLTEPGTPPDRLARKARDLGLRRGARLYVRQVEALDSPQLIRLLERIGLAGDRGGIVDAYLAGGMLVVVGPGLRTLEVPIASVSAFRGHPPEVLPRFEVDPDGSFLYWPDLDVHLGWDQFLQVVDPDALRKSRRRNVEFNERYGAAIRRVREGAGLSQSRVAGITGRHLRRIERGESPASSNALAALAEAHGVDPDVYLGMLAKALR